MVSSKLGSLYRPCTLGMTNIQQNIERETMFSIHRRLAALSPRSSCHPAEAAIRLKAICSEAQLSGKPVLLGRPSRHTLWQACSETTARIGETAGVRALHTIIATAFLHHRTKPDFPSMLTHILSSFKLQRSFRQNAHGLEDRPPPHTTKPSD